MLFSERFGEDLPQRSKNVFFRGSESLLKGLVFLGTPFEGSLMANNFLPLIRAVDRINPFPMNRDLISQLRHVKNADGDLSFLSKEASIIFSQNKIEILIGCENAPYFSIGSALVRYAALSFDAELTGIGNISPVCHWNLRGQNRSYHFNRLAYRDCQVSRLQ